MQRCLLFFCLLVLCLPLRVAQAKDTVESTYVTAAKYAAQQAIKTAQEQERLKGGADDAKRQASRLGDLAEWIAEQTDKNRPSQLTLRLASAEKDAAFIEGSTATQTQNLTASIMDPMMSGPANVSRAMLDNAKMYCNPHDFGGAAATLCGRGCLDHPEKCNANIDWRMSTKGRTANREVMMALLRTLVLSPAALDAIPDENRTPVQEANFHAKMARIEEASKVLAKALSEYIAVEGATGCDYAKAGLVETGMSTNTVEKRYGAGCSQASLDNMMIKTLYGNPALLTQAYGENTTTLTRTAVAMGAHEADIDEKIREARATKAKLMALLVSISTEREAAEIGAQAKSNLVASVQTQ